MKPYLLRLSCTTSCATSCTTIASNNTYIDIAIASVCTYCNCTYALASYHHRFDNYYNSLSYKTSYIIASYIHS